MAKRLKDKHISGAGAALFLSVFLLGQPVAAQTDHTVSELPASDTSATAIRKPPLLTGKVARIFSDMSKQTAGRDAPPQDWKAAQEKAVLAARDSHYDVALPALEQLHNAHPQDLGIAADYAAVLGWAGRDADAVAHYQALPAGNRPDYLIASIGHSYRNLHQPQQALAVYRLGLQTYPDNQSFLGGEIFSLLEAGQTDEAVAHAQDAANTYPDPSQPLASAIKEASHVNAVTMARKGDTRGALQVLEALHKQSPQDENITGDMLTVSSWAGRDADVVTLFKSIRTQDRLDYVLDAAAHSYRSLHDSKKALALYKEALAKNPDNLTYAVGVIDTLSDLGRTGEAMNFTRQQLAKHPQSDELIKAYTRLERRRALELAHAGYYDPALEILRDIHAKYPADAGGAMDYIAVSSWAGHDQEATAQYEKLSRRKMPDYVLEAVGHSYRRLHETDKALAVYQRGLEQAPSNDIFAAGVIRCLDDLGRYGDGVASAQRYTTARYGDHLEVLLAGGEAANFNDDPVGALTFYQRAAGVSPSNEEALRGLIHAEDHIGAPQLALQQADQHPGLMKRDEYRALVGDSDSALVRWGPLEPESEATRYKDIDIAIASLDQHIGEWKTEDDPAVTPSIMRARFDRLVALRDRQRMQDAVDDYQALVNEGVEVPPYALEPVGEAYLSLRQPEIARDIFLKVLESSPNDFEARRLLAYAYLECGQYDDSYAAIDKLTADEPKWIYLKGEPERQPNAAHALALIDSAELRAYADELDDAGDRITPVADAAPFDARNRAALGNIELMRGQPRAAREQYEIGKAIQNGRDVANETGTASADLDLQHFRAAEAETQDLMQRFPENTDAQRANRLLEVHHMAELDVHAGYNFLPYESNSSFNNSPHGQGFGIGGELYSSPIDYDWRLFAGQDWAHEHEPNDEGLIDYFRSNAGVEYRNGDVTASAAPTLNIYNGVNRVGADGKASYSFNDMWSAGIAAELFSQNTPLRALNAGITANQFGFNGLWRQNETRSVSFGAYAMPFSDGNFRTVQNAEYIRRLYTDPVFRLDLEGDLATSQNSKNEDRRYYNPSLDLSALIGLRGTQVLYHRYETQWEHSLLAMPGFYSEQRFGTSAAWTVRYEHRIRYNDTLNAGVGVDYTHQDYDGSAEDAVSLTMDVVERF